MAGLHASAFINSNRDVKAHPEPIVLPMPWPAAGSTEQVSAEERASLRAQLLRRSAFAA